MMSIFSCTQHIDSLEKNTLKYKQLPKPVKERLFEVYGDLPEKNKQNITEEYIYSFRDLNTPSNYEYYTKQEFFFRWIYNGYIKNKETGKIYSLKNKSNIERSNQYIIYGDSLYIANHYNIHEKDSLNYTFTRFILN